jgi:hypothetical protein
MPNALWLHQFQEDQPEKNYTVSPAGWMVKPGEVDVAYGWLLSYVTL